jgi:hypothetical protein
MSAIAHPLRHRTTWLKPAFSFIKLPFIDDLRAFHPEGDFYLTEDPLETKKACILGMFVLRPAVMAWKGELDWAFNLRSCSGGWVVANKNAVDAYRLALQYALSDAVMVGTHSICSEGIGEDGYVWQPYTLCKWDQLQSADPNLYDKFVAQRKKWQEMGYLSTRQYPAQIVFTWSGEARAGSPDFLEARIFKEKTPDGKQMEVYILTSAKGAMKIKERIHKYPLLQARLSTMLIVVPGSSSSFDVEADIDISLLPKMLYDKLDMRIVNHDGGHKVLQEFCKAGAINQMVSMYSIFLQLYPLISLIYCCFTEYHLLPSIIFV